MKRSLPFWMLGLLCVIAVALTRSASAQGTSDAFPDPMVSDDMMGILDRVGLEGNARVNALKTFEEYVSRSLDLRKGDIDEYLKNRPAPATSPTRDDIKARIDARSRLLKRIAAIENQLFDELGAQVPESARVALDRERNRAERRRDWIAANSFLSRGSRIELSDALRASLDGATLAPEVQGRVDGLLIAFEQQQTALSRKLLELAINEPVAMFDARAAAGVTQPSTGGDAPAAPDAWQNYFKAMEQARATARAPQSEIRTKLRTLVRETARQVADALPPQTADKFRRGFVASAYPNVASPRDPVPSLVTDARKLAEKNEITKDELSTVENLAQTHAMRRTEINERLMDTLDKLAAKQSAMSFRFSSGEDEADQDGAKLQSLFDSRAALDAATVTAITGSATALAAAAPKEIEERGGTAIVNGMTIDLGGMEFGGEGNAVMIVADAGGGDFDGGSMVFTAGISLPRNQTGTPPPIKRDQLDGWRDRFGLSADAYSIATILLDDYTSKFTEIEAGELAELGSLPSSMGFMRTDINGAEPKPATKQTIARQFELRRSVIDRVAELDREFFDGLAAAVGSAISAKDLTRIRHERERASLIGAGESGMLMMGPGGFGASNVPTLDFAEIVRESKLPAASAKSLDGIVDDWDATSLSAFRQRFESHFAAERLRAEFDVDMAAKARADGHPGEIRVESSDAGFEKIEAANRKASEGDALTRTVNENTITVALGALPDDESRLVLRDAWNRKAWPEVYRDSRDVEPKITMALGFADITAEQKAAVNRIAAEHRAEYRRIIDEMIATNEKFAPKPDAERDDRPGNEIRNLQAKQDAQKRLKFERNELNEKTLRRLKDALAPEQAAKLGDLAKPATIRMGGPAGATSETRIERNQPAK